MEPRASRPEDDTAARTTLWLVSLLAANLAGCACGASPSVCPSALETVTCPGATCTIPCTQPANCRFDVTVVWSSQLGCRDTVDDADCVCSSAGVVSCPDEPFPERFVAPHCIDASEPDDASLENDSGTSARMDAMVDAGART